MNFKWVLCFCMITACESSVRAQTAIDQVIEQIIGHLAEKQQDELDYSELTELLLRYAESPLDLNTVQGEELLGLMFLNEIQVSNLIRFRNETGKFMDVLEIQAVDGFDRYTAFWLSQFVKVATVSMIKELSSVGSHTSTRHDLIVRFGQIIQKQEGYVKREDGGKTYYGSPLRLFARYRAELGKSVQIALNMEKDAGEPFFSQHSTGFDFYSGNILLKGAGYLRKIIIGDYAAQFGQGLTLWSGLGFSGGTLVTAVAKSGMGIKPYTSANESSFLRGVASEWSAGSFRVTPFVAYNTLDASLSADGSGVSTILKSGLHRTTSERGNKNRLSQLITGLNIQYGANNLKIGSTCTLTSFSMPVSRSDEAYRKFDFFGNRLINLGIDYTYATRRAFLFGESAYSSNGGIAVLNGLMTSPSQQLSLVFLHRYYQPRYQSFFTQSFSESGSTSNETGLYTGLILKPKRNWDITAYSDLFRFPWLRYRADRPSMGSELLVQFNYYPGKKLNASFRVKSQVKEGNGGNDTVASIDRTHFRLDLSYQLTRDVSLRTRCELSKYSGGVGTTESGFLAYQDIVYKPMSSRLSGNIRVGIFDTDGFNSRIYAYENDVLYGYSIPAVQNSGLRWYANLRWDLMRNFSVWLKYSNQSISDDDQIGSAGDLINGNKRSEMKMQLRCRF